MISEEQTEKKKKEIFLLKFYFTSKTFFLGEKFSQIDLMKFWADPKKIGKSLVEFVIRNLKSSKNPQKI